ncbi:protealysin inhibitor emfourin [Massilia sp. 9096]|uniref:protealysin inhibitor emfourin n=1 Tax=Massilia sp. 9096 TaxID=1500894 RepID=UPI000689D6AC|nr:protealysin inhibitor emfourin [Massilia sp. 9096]
MRLSLHWVGGFTGPAGAQTVSVELERLPAADAARLHALVAALDPAHLPASLMKPHPQPWDFVYTLTIENGQRRQLRFHTDAAPEPLGEIVDILQQYPPDNSG